MMAMGGLELERRILRRPGGDLEPLHAKEGISLLFEAGARPVATDIERILAAHTGASRTAQIGHRPPDDHGWIELLASGLTFELRGLAPGTATPLPQVDHVYGLPADIEKFGLEAVTLAPGPHIAAGGGLMPVVRIHLALAASLALELPIVALCWNPARSWMDPKYFGRVVVNWLSGGGFPALGLTGLRRADDGGLESSGLAYFIGQEVRVPPRPDEPQSETMHLAGRMIDHLVRHGPLEDAARFSGPTGESLLAEPSADGRHVLVARAA